MKCTDPVSASVAVFPVSLEAMVGVAMTVGGAACAADKVPGPGECTGLSEVMGLRMGTQMRMQGRGAAYQGEGGALGVLSPTHSNVGWK